MPIYALISREYFGPKILGTIYGTIFMVSSIGMGLGGYFGGLIFDITGNYKWLFIIAGGIGSFAAYMAYMLKPPGVKEIQGQWVKPELTG
jgi:MFS family permease